MVAVRPGWGSMVCLTGLAPFDRGQQDAASIASICRAAQRAAARSRRLDALAFRQSSSGQRGDGFLAHRHSRSGNRHAAQRLPSPVGERTCAQRRGFAGSCRDCPEALSAGSAFDLNKAQDGRRTLPPAMTGSKGRQHPSTANASGGQQIAYQCLLMHKSCVL